ncbi:TBC1 domain family member 10B-like [Syngnathus typhle]|uniref:TBC1 domain family member 10B-like n=1 Tax=Syngnathus typhle TaxID=161592 RepID=UPI002A69FE8E|nr:TBC1 domain family member 10B-like [Syngnathus typhle]
MAELSALSSPPPPTSVDGHAPSASSVASKSLCNDVNLIRNTPAVPLTPPLQGLSSADSPQKEEVAGPDAPVEADVPQQASLSPDLTPGPNLYPSVHITHNPPPPATNDVPVVPPVAAPTVAAPPVAGPLVAATEVVAPPVAAPPVVAPPVVAPPVVAPPVVAPPVAAPPVAAPPVLAPPVLAPPVAAPPVAAPPVAAPPVAAPPVSAPPVAATEVAAPAVTPPVAQKPQQAPKSPPPPVYPKPQSPIKAQPPCSPPPRAGHPSPPVPHPGPTVPLIQEPAPPCTPPPRAGHSSPTLPLIQEPSFPGPPGGRRPAPDTLSYLESASLMSGTLESLSGIGDDGSSLGSDSEINGLAVRRTDKYGFLGGNQFSEGSDKDVRVEVARQREMKWLDMFNNWDKWVKHRFQKIKMRCRKGIPSSLRSKAWQLLSNSQELLDANPGKFEELEREPGEAKWLDIIEKDLHRQFPFHEMFAARGGHGQQDLYRILKAYTVYRPDEGYCQAQAPVAAVLLMHMPAEQAFWCLVQICEKFLPGYYSAGLEAIQLDGEIFFSLLRRTCPMAYRHLKKFKIDPILYMTEWFMCIFSRTLPWACVLRVWDMFFCEGVKIIFRVGLVLLKQMLGSVDKLREVQGMYETMERLRGISPDTIGEDSLVQEVILLQVTEALIERECTVQVRKWRESRGELTHQPGRRLHGTRAIFEHKRRAAAISSGGSFSFLGSSVPPPPGPLRASSSLLSLPGFRKSRNPFHSPGKKSSFSGPSFSDGTRPQSPPAAGSQKPPIPPQRAPQVQSPLVGTGPQSGQSAPTPNALAPSPRVVSEQITPTIPSPTANNTPLMPGADDAGNKGAAEATPPARVEEDGRKKKKSKEDKKKEREDEKKRLKEKKDKDKAEKERLKKDKERLEKEKKKVGKKKDKGAAGPGPEHGKNGAAAAAAKDSPSSEHEKKKEAE